jgi:hypothetical protein
MRHCRQGWRPRFAAAYRIQNQAWIDSISARAMTVAISHDKRPGLYAWLTPGYGVTGAVSADQTGDARL